MNLPPLALSIGEPSGIGPEIAVKARLALGAALPFFVIGDPTHLPGGTIVTLVGDPRDVEAVPAGSLPVLPLRFDAPAEPGRPSAANARGVIAAIERGVALAMSGSAAGLVTNPISKLALKTGAGFGFPGHTEFLAHLAGVGQVAMMLASDALKVVPVTIHVPLAEVPGLVAADLVEATIRLADASLRRDFGILRPRIAVSGLNPHAGEGGTIGGEEAAAIAPAIARLRAEGLDVTGPWPADTMFTASARARYDVAVAMYHDQALIPIKALAFESAVNVTLGLPFVRTSPDHGTAFDIAGKGVADPSSLIAALRLAARMAATRR